MVGVNVLSELSSGPVTPSDLCSFFACLRAARDLNVGRAMAKILTEANWRNEGGWRRSDPGRGTMDDEEVHAKCGSL